jgi:hypothetical protein
MPAIYCQDFRASSAASTIGKLIALSPSVSLLFSLPTVHRSLPTIHRQYKQRLPTQYQQIANKFAVSTKCLPLVVKWTGL